MNNGVEDILAGMDDDVDLDDFFGLFGDSRKKTEKVDENKLPPRQRTAKLNINNYQTPQGQNTLVKDLIEKINELIMRVELTDAKCDGQTLEMRKMQKRITDLETSVLP